MGPELKDKLAILAEQYKVKATYLEETTSTNDVARDPAYKEGDLIVAEKQNSGRGQRGNSWESRPGNNLTISIVLKPITLAPDKQFMLSETISLAITDMLESYGMPAKVKWPNDIYVRGKKIAGILIENDISGGEMTRSIVGIGLNVNQRRFDRSLRQATSMRLVADEEFDRGEVLRNLYRAISIRYTSLVNDYVSTLERDYHARLYLAGERHDFRLPDGRVFNGFIRRVEQSGELIVEHSDGQNHGYLFKEIIF